MTTWHGPNRDAHAHTTRLEPRWRTEYRIVANGDGYKKVWRTQTVAKIDTLFANAEHRYPDARIHLETRRTTDWEYHKDATNLMDTP